MSIASAEPVRIAMPSKSMTFLNFYLADKFGLFKNEGGARNFAEVVLLKIQNGKI